MNTTACPKCKSTNIATERKPDGNHFCGNCHFEWPNVMSQPGQTICIHGDPNPMFCQKCKMENYERESRVIRNLVNADPNEATEDEVERLVHEKDDYRKALFALLRGINFNTHKSKSIDAKAKKGWEALEKWAKTHERSKLIKEKS